MPNFRYTARDKFSRPITGEISGDDKYGAARKLQELGYTPVSIEVARQSSIAQVLGSFKRVRLEEVGAFTRQLYSLQKAGLPLLSSLESVSQQAKNPYFKAVIEQVTADIKGGLSFSSALKGFERVFDNIYISMIKSAETSGNLSGILERLAILIEQEIDTRARIKAATRYPVLAFLALCLGFLIVVIFVIPRFSAVYSQFNTLLPLATRVLIAVSFAVRKFYLLFIAGGVFCVFGLKRFVNSKAGRAFWDGLKLKIPVIGPLLTMLVMSRFARVTAILMKSGVPILEVLELAASSSGNVIISRGILNIKESVNQGKGLSEPMKVSSLFPAAVTQMVAVGEQTGRVDELLLSVADYYDIESGYMIKNLTTYIEPALIFALAVMVLVMALAIFLPMWNLIRVFKAA